MEENKVLTIPLDFKIACIVYQLKPENVLQSFVNHVSLFMSLSSGYLKGYREATNTLAEYSINNVVREGSPAITENNRDLTIKLIKSIISIGQKKGISQEQKRKRCIPIVKQLNNSLNHQLTKKNFYLSEDFALNLSDDFRIRCEMHQHTPKEFLEYFMSKISLADRDARVSLNKVNENPALGFFELMTYGLTRNIKDKLSNPEAMQDFIDEFQRIPYDLFIVRDLEKRRKALEEFYLKHYNELIKVI